MKHTSEAVSHVFGMESLSAGAFEVLQKRFKTLVCKPLSFQPYCHEWGCIHAERGNHGKHWQYHQQQTWVKGHKRNRRRSAEPVLVHSRPFGAKYTRLALELIMLEAEAGKKVPVDAQEERQTAKNLFATLGSGRYRIFVWLLRLYFIDRGESFNLSRHKMVCKPKSAHFSSCKAPTL